MKIQPAIVGLGRSDYRALWNDKNHGLDEQALAAQVFEQALADSGLPRRHIDGVLVSRVEDGRGLCRRLKLDPSWFMQADGRGRQCGPALLEAVGAIREGKARNVAIIYANDGRSRRQTYGGQRDYASQYGDVYGFTSPGAWLGAAWRRYCHLYGADERVLANLAVGAREAAALDPCSLPLPPLDEEAYLASPFVTEPLRRADYCPVNDGAVCLILTGRPQAQQRPVFVPGGAWRPMPPGLYMGEDFFFTVSQQVASDLSRQGLSLQEKRPDLLLIYDNFTPNLIFALEGFGLSRQGRAWQEVADATLPPINPGGGMLAGSYMQGWNLLHEAALQLSGRAGARQVRCRRAAYLCTAALVSAVVLTNEEEDPHD